MDVEGQFDLMPSVARQGVVPAVGPPFGVQDPEKEGGLIRVDLAVRIVVAGDQGDVVHVQPEFESGGPPVCDAELERIGTVAGTFLPEGGAEVLVLLEDKPERAPSLTHIGAVYADFVIRTERSVGKVSRIKVEELYGTGLRVVIGIHMLVGGPYGPGLQVHFADGHMDVQVTRKREFSFLCFGQVSVDKVIEREERIFIGVSQDQQVVPVHADQELSLAQTGQGVLGLLTLGRTDQDLGDALLDGRVVGRDAECGTDPVGQHGPELPAACGQGGGTGVRAQDAVDPADRQYVSVPGLFTFG